jgi:cyclopropane fatty-acyl-phospholipid synthase-like methyltransferase
MGALSQTHVMLMCSEACERNKDPILEVLVAEFAACTRVLEIGSGTGQHAVYFAAHLPRLSWQPSEVREQLPQLAERVRLEGTANLRPPLELDVCDEPWRAQPTDAIFSANTLHIMGWSAVRQFFCGLGRLLGSPAVLCVYGPFRFHGAYTSDSNAEFDRYLRARDPLSGIRDFESLDELARAQDLQFSADHAMPANNRTLVWRRPARVPT